jgi:hypothetical protein
MRILLIGFLAFTLSCDKDNETVIEKKSPTELLTQKNWVLTSFGHDYDSNGIVEGSEEEIQECQKDNTYLFKANGEGEYAENALVCGNGITETFFPWKWVVEGKSLEISLQPVNILRLNETELAIYVEIAGSNGQPVKFITTYRH